MKKNKLKSQAGITLTTLMITIVVLSILVAIVVRHVDTGTDLRNYNYMKADIDLLYSKIMTYYNENNSIPTTGDAFNAKTTLGGQASSRDNDNYYQIDLSQLYNITLNFGGGTLQNGDIYIVNEQSHEVYYFKGVVVDNEKYYHPVSNNEQKTINDTTITIANCELKTKTINSITVEATATSSNSNDNITYELYTSTTENGDYTKQGQSVSKVQNTSVELTASGLDNYTVYYWYVKASSTATVQSIKTRTRTKCPGTGKTIITETVTCPNCNGTKTVTETCKGGSSCSTCNGTGKVTCTGTIEIARAYNFACTSCGSKSYYFYTCSSCGYEVGRKCASCGETNGTTSTGGTCGRSVSCSNCTNGKRPCTHGNTSSHTYTTTCKTCNGTGETTTTVTGCVHEKTEEHDEL